MVKIKVEEETVVVVVVVAEDVAEEGVEGVVAEAVEDKIMCLTKILLLNFYFFLKHLFS